MRNSTKLLKWPVRVCFFSLLAFVVGALVHNLYYAVFRAEEAVFFFIAVAGMALFVLFLSYIIIVVMVLLLKRK